MAINNEGPIEIVEETDNKEKKQSRDASLSHEGVLNASDGKCHRTRRWFLATMACKSK